MDILESSRPVTAAGCLQPENMPRRPSWFETAPTAGATALEELRALTELPVQLGVVPHDAHLAMHATAVPRAAHGGTGGTPPSPLHIRRDGSTYRPASKRRPRHLAALEDVAAGCAGGRQQQQPGVREGTEQRGPTPSR
jgi:hypothetical protein